MTDATTVLVGQTIVYTAYAVAILIVMGMFAYNITRDGESSNVKDKYFYTFAGFLILLGMSLHVVTYNTIPWTPTDVHRGDIVADKEFVITVADHEFNLPSEQLLIDCGEMVLFENLIGGIGMGAFMGMAGLQSMLRHTLYFEGEYFVYMFLAAVSGALLLAALAAFLYNIVMTVGLKGALGIFQRSDKDADLKQLLPVE